MKSEEKTAVVQLFNGIAPSYDFLNDLLSLGLHRLWKRELLACLNPKPGEYWIDVCCGTGDLAFALARRLRTQGRVVALDAAAEALAFAKKRARQKRLHSVTWMQGDALHTGLDSHVFDVTKAYFQYLRNQYVR